MLNSTNITSLNKIEKIQMNDLNFNKNNDLKEENFSSFESLLDLLLSKTFNSTIQTQSIDNSANTLNNSIKNSFLDRLKYDNSRVMKNIDQREYVKIEKKSLDKESKAINRKDNKIENKIEEIKDSEDLKKTKRKIPKRNYKVYTQELFYLNISLIQTIVTDLNNKLDVNELSKSKFSDPIIENSETLNNFINKLSNILNNFFKLEDYTNKDVPKENILSVLKTIKQELLLLKENEIFKNLVQSNEFQHKLDYNLKLLDSLINFFASKDNNELENNEDLHFNKLVELLNKDLKDINKNFTSTNKLNNENQTSEKQYISQKIFVELKKLSVEFKEIEIKLNNEPKISKDALSSLKNMLSQLENNVYLKENKVSLNNDFNQNSIQIDQSLGFNIKEGKKTSNIINTFFNKDGKGKIFPTIKEDNNQSIVSNHQNGKNFSEIANSGKILNIEEVKEPENLIKTEKSTKNYGKNIIEQIKSEFKKYTNIHKVKHITVKLEPKTLGKLDIELVFKDKDLKMHIKVLNPETHAILKENIHHLKETLNNIGINIVNIDLEMKENNEENFKEALNKEFGSFKDNSKEKENLDYKEDSNGNKRFLKRKYGNSRYEIII